MCEISDGIVLAFLIIASLFDWRTKMLPNYLLVCMSVLVVFLRVVAVSDGWLLTLGGVGIGLIFWFISRGTKEAIGYGDSWMIVLLGVYLGGVRLSELLMVAFFTAGLFALGILIRRKCRKGVSIPLVPFLAIGFVGVMLS